MKHIYFWMLTLFCFSVTFAQLTEDFESETLDGWSSYATGEDDPGFIRTEAQKNSGEYSYYHNDNNLSAESTSYFVSPSYTVQSGDEFSVFVYQNYSATYYNYSGVYISTGSNDPIANPSDFTELLELGSNFAEDEWVRITESLDAYAGETVHFAFVYTGDFSHEFYIDDLYVGASCTAPEATVTEVPDCSNFEYSVNVEVTDFGSSSSVLISDNFGNAQTVSSLGTYTFGPYASNSTVEFDIANAANSFCKTTATAYFVCPPANDDCTGATELSSFPYTETLDATGSTQSDFLSCNNVVYNDGVWFTFEGESALYTINLTSYGFDSAVGVFSGSCDELNCVTAIDDATADSEEVLEFVGQAGVIYYVAVGNRNGSIDAPEGEFDIEILEEAIPCSAPSDLSVSAVDDSSATLNWSLNSENETYDIVYGPSGFTPGTDASNTGLVEAPYTLTGLSPETSYDLYIRGNCNPGYSDWVGPISFTTLEEGAVLPGTDCNSPIEIAALPYNTSDTTENYGDTYDGSPGDCEASNYLNGDDVVYAYTPTEDTSIDISMTPQGTYSGIFVYDDCANIGSTCLAGVSGYSEDVRLIEELYVTGGQTYYIVISTWASPQTVDYSLSIIENTCIDGTFELTAEGDCDNEQFYVNVEVSDFGTLTSYTVTDNQGNDAQTITELGSLTFGPYASMTEVEFTFEANDTNCNDSASISYRCPGVGDNCENPLVVDSLPYSTQDDTANYYDDYDGGQGSNCGNDSQYYLSGDDVVYAYTPTEDGSVDIELIPTNTWSGIFVYESCEDIGVNCVAGVADSGSAPRLIEEFSVFADQTYYIVISTWSAPQSTEYELNITENTCISPTYEVSTAGQCVDNEFYVEFNYTDLGSLSSVEITDDQGGATQTVTAAGTYTFGPYASETEVNFDLVADDTNCSSTETFSYRCPAVGDNCDNPLIVDSLPYTTQDTTANYYDDYNGSAGENCGSTSNYLGGDDVVYAYTASEDTSINISLNPDATYSGIFVYESCADIGVNCVAGVADYSSDERLIEEFAVVAGQTYYIVISTYPAPQSVDYTLNITENTCISPEYNIEYVENCDAGEYSVNVNVSSLGSSSSITFTDDQGSVEQVLNEVGTVTVGPYASGEAVELTLTTDDSNCNSTESLSYSCPGENDSCDNAVELTVGTSFEEYAITANNFGATDSGVEAPSCGSYGGADVWFSFVVPDSGIAMIQTGDAGTSTLSDTTISAYAGSCDGGLVEIECDDDDGDGFYSYLELSELTPGEVVFVRVWDYASNDEGTFLISVYDDNTCVPAEYTTSTTLECEVTQTYTVQFDFTSLGSAASIDLVDNVGGEVMTVSDVGTVEFGPYEIGSSVTISADTGDDNCYFEESFLETCPPENTDCESATELTVGTSFDDSPLATTNEGADNSDVENPSCASYQGGDVWFSAVVPESGYLTVETGYSDPDQGLDTGLSVYTGSCDTGLTEVDCNDDGGESTFSKLELSGLTPGETIYIRVWEYGNNMTGIFAVSVYDDTTCTPAEYTSSSDVNCEEGTYTVTYDFANLGSASSITLSDDQGNAAFTLDEAGSVEFGPYEEGAEVVITVDTGDENCNFTETFASVCGPVNDECIDAIAVDVEIVDAEPTQWTEGTISGATDSGVEAPTCDGYSGTPNDDVWYSFVATNDYTYITLDDNFDGVVELFSGECGGLVSLACADIGTNPEIEATNLTIGEVYYVRVFNYSSSAAADPAFSLAIWTYSLAVSDIASNRNLKLYPNPTSDLLNVSGLEIQEVQVYATSGKLVKVSINDNVVDVSQLPTGTYIIRLLDIEGNVTLRKFIKK